MPLGWKWPPVTCANRTRASLAYRMRDSPRAARKVAKPLDRLRIPLGSPCQTVTTVRIGGKPSKLWRGSDSELEFATRDHSLGDANASHFPSRRF